MNEEKINWELFNSLCKKYNVNTNTKSTNRDLLLDLGYDDVIIFDNPSYEGALIGVTWGNQAVYDYDLMIESLMKEDNMTEEEAVDFISYNASYTYGYKYPIIMDNVKKWRKYD